MVKSRKGDLRTIWDASLDRGVEDPLEGTVWDVYCQYGEPEPIFGDWGRLGGRGLSLSLWPELGVGERRAASLAQPGYHTLPESPSLQRELGVGERWAARLAQPG